MVQFESDSTSPGSELQGCEMALMVNNFRFIYTQLIVASGAIDSSPNFLKVA